MPKLTVEGVGEFEVPQGKRLVLALESMLESGHLGFVGGRYVALLPLPDLERVADLLNTAAERKRASEEVAGGGPKT